MGEADVYAGDLDLAAGQGVAPVFGSFEYRITADASADVWARVANQFGLANQPPLHASLRTTAAGEIEFVVVLGALSAALAATIARKLSQQIMVTGVELKLLSTPER